MAQSAGGGGGWTEPFAMVRSLNGSKQEISDKLVGRLSAQEDLSNPETREYLEQLKASIPSYKLFLGNVGLYKRTNAMYDALEKMLN